MKNNKTILTLVIIVTLLMAAYFSAVMVVNAKDRGEEPEERPGRERPEREHEERPERERPDRGEQRLREYRGYINRIRGEMREHPDRELRS